MYIYIYKYIMDNLTLKIQRKTRTTKNKLTEPTIAPTAKQKETSKDSTIIKPNTKTNKLKDATDIFKIQKKKEQETIKQELKEYAALTKGVSVLNKSIAKLAKQK